MIVLDHSAAHKFVREQRRAGNDVRWEGWTMIFWKPTHYGYSSVNGAFRNRRWGVESRISVDDNGLWKVPARNVKPTG